MLFQTPQKEAELQWQTWPQMCITKHHEEEHAHGFQLHTDNTVCFGLQR